MHRTVLVVAATAALLTGLPSPGFSAARMENWTTLKGEKIRGKAIDVIGPFAWFETDKGGGKRVLLSHLSEADCVRFSRAIGQPPARSPRWTQAASPATKAVIGNVQILIGSSLGNPDLGAVAEPEFLILVFGGTGSVRSAEAIREFIPEYRRLREKYGDRVEAIYLGVGNNQGEQERMVDDLDLPFLIENYDRRLFLKDLRSYAPGKPPALWVMARQGVPVAFSECKTKGDLERACLELETVFALMRPNNGRTWQDRLHYYRAMRRAAFATGRGEPMLIGHPLDLDELKKAGLESVVADLKVSADGKVTSAVLQPTAGLTRELATAIGQALLQSAVFVPAVENGQFVDGTFELRL